jgi:hypothetical protein
MTFSFLYSIAVQSGSLSLIPGSTMGSIGNNEAMIKFHYPPPHLMIGDKSLSDISCVCSMGTNREKGR